MKQHFRSLALATSAFALLASACGGGSSSSTSGGDAKPGGTVFLLWNADQFTDLDPQRNYVNVDMAVATTLLYRTLTSYAYAKGDGGSALVADLATDTGTPSADAKTWSFTLRDGVTFEDGSAITCADVAYGVSRTFAQDVIVGGPTYAISFLDIADDPNDDQDGYPGPYTATPDQQAAFDKAVTCSDDGKTVTFHLKQAVADFNYTVTLPAFSPVPKAKDTGEGYTKAPVSSGPYKIESYESGKSLVLVRNDKWNKSSDPLRKAYPDKFVVQFALDPAVIDERMMADAGDDQTAISLTGILPENLQTIFNDPKYEQRREDGLIPAVSWLAFNVASVSCKEVRQAVWLSTDREALRTAAGGPYTGEFADGFIPQSLTLDYAKNTLPEGMNADGKPNVEAAKAKLAEAKTKCPDVYAKATGDGLKVDFADDPTAAKLFAIRQESAKAAGIVLVANPIEPSKYYPTVLNPETQGDLSGGGWFPDWANGSTVIPELFADGGFNITQNSNDPEYAAFQEKVDAARKEVDREKQGKMWQELNQFVVDQMWSMPGVFSKQQDIWGSKVGGVYRWVPWGTFNLGDVYVKS